MAGWSKELESLEQVMQVYEELGGESSKGIDDLVTPYRRFVRTNELALREAPFSSSKKVEHRAYLFRDLLLLARPTNGTLGKVGSRLSGKYNERKSGSKGWKGRYKLARRLDLDKVSNVIAIERPDSDKTYGIQLTYVTRHREKKAGTSKVITKIEKLELWFRDSKDAANMKDDLATSVEELMEQELLRRESAVSDGGALGAGRESTGGNSTGPPEKKRSWALRKNTLKRTGTLGRKASTSTLGDSVSGLSLADLEGRYHVDFGHEASGSGERVEFLVEFGEGPMGFSLGSGAGVGVIVGRLAPNSFSEVAGVCIGDRVVSINDKEVSLGNTWQEAVEIIKSSPRPITLKFERVAGRVVQDPSTESKSRSEPPPGSAEAGGGPRERTTSQKRRAWAARRAARGTDSGGIGERLISLKELEKMYQSAEQQSSETEAAIQLFDTIVTQNDHEKQCVSVLKEILETERAYVNDLRALVGDYILPLRRTMRRTKCRDVEGGSKICEHNLIRSTCNRTTTEANPLLNSDEIGEIFMNVETLVKVNTELLNVLQTGFTDLAASGQTPSLKQVAGVYAHAFVRVMPFFKMYAHYCHQYPVAIDRLLICRSRNADLNVFLQTREERSNATSLNSLLIKPVQRICKYPLLFRELLKHMLAMSMQNIDGYISELEEAATAVEQIAASVNKKVGEKESMESLMEVYDELGGEEGVPGLVTAHRRYIRMDDVLIRDAPFHKNEKKRHYIYLFNDLMLFARGTGAAWNTTSKTGTGSRTSTGRSLSLRKAFRSTGSLRKSRGMSGTLKKTSTRVTKWVELRSCTVKAIAAPDSEGCYAIDLKYVERETQKSTAKKGTGKVVTSINKYEIWCATEEARDGMLVRLQECLDKLENLESGHRKAQASVGTPRQKRTWMRKRDSGASGASGNSDLRGLASKYGTR